uniref:Uncharacterized protein n=1 Tax=Percolomonas cosmopolitus TaxID=63605 RepID=A0A7S1KPZ9_9EUKA|mmetsp:Transcript_4643/g.17485  ORF Transcript_4643/g.17485 Transcript_4643/m.17485 type:complete len:356 (+) Transcript_4643:193-1260(+)
MRNRNQSKPHHNFSQIVPDCVNEIFKYYIQKVSCEQTKKITRAEKEFFSEQVVCWEFDQDCDNVAGFLKNTRGNKRCLFYVDLSNNEHLTKEVFPYLRGVIELDISYCRKIDDQAMANLGGVQKLCLKGVDSKKLTNEGFRNLRSCIELDISECSQETIGDAAFENLRNLRVLRMAHCFQESITDQSFTNLRNCIELDMSGCHQPTITDKAFENLRTLRKLRMLNVHQNSISDKAFTNLRNCIELDMSGCHQPTITDKAFENLRNVRVLHMFACDQPFSVEIFRNFDSIEELDMRMCSDKLLEVWMSKFVIDFGTNAAAIEENKTSTEKPEVATTGKVFFPAIEKDFALVSNRNL